MPSKPAVFLDRDGTLNVSVGYVNHADRFELFPWTIDAIRLIRDEGYLAVMVTNQSGIGRGFFPAELVDSIHGRFRSQLEAAGAGLDGIYVCPHVSSEDCDCRKPAPGMLRQASSELDIDLERSWMVGDTVTDLQAGWAAGTRAALVRTGFGAGTLEHESAGWDRQPDLVGENVFRVACDIAWGARASTAGHPE